MKYLCLDRDACAYSRSLTQEEYKTLRFDEIFYNCEACNYYMILVKDDFNLDELQNIHSAIIAINKIIKKVQN
tara:strand:+ start:703 stop:921 length:219 start_codon:yes stop_codon:yes gene_type:complete